VRVLYLVSQPKSPERIGAYTFLDEEIQGLAAAGVDAYVLSTRAPRDTLCGRVRLQSADARAGWGARMRAAVFLGRRLGDIPSRNLAKPLQSYRSARLEHLAAELVREHKIDLIHSHFGWPQGFGGTLARAATGRPLVASLRGTDILLDSSIDYGRRVDPLFDRALRRLLRTADRTIYFSDYMRNQGVALGARRDATRVVRKGVDVSHFRPTGERCAVKRELGLDGRPMILSVGGLIPRKGVHDILEALALLRDSHDFTFVVCGDGPERERLQALARDLGLESRTRFTGRVDRQTIPKYFAACDLMILASTLEAAGNVLFEAMAAARPVICTDSGGPPEYVQNDETGFVVPVANPQMMAARVRLLLESEELRERLGREARRRTEGQFAYTRMVSDIIDVYRDALTTAPSSSRTPC
jgi:glycosyltransferase involved in cell wall biosynthesis